MPQQLRFPVSTLVTEISKTLRDEIGVVFDVATEILPVLNLATSEIVNTDPDALVKNVPFQLAPFFATIQTQGTGYTDGDTLTAVGGTFTTAATFLVAGTNGGAIDVIVPLNYGSYTAYPTSPISVTGGTGTGCKLNFALLGGKQDIPPDGASLVAVRRFLGSDGQTIGPMIEECQMDEMTAFRPSWPMDVCGIYGQPAYPIHYMTVKEDAKRFYLWPYPNVMSVPAFVELIYRAVPDNMTLTDNFALPALYMPAAKYYTLAHVMLRLDQNDKRFEKCQKLIPIYLDLFRQSLGSASATTQMTAPPHPLNRKR